MDDNALTLDTASWKTEGEWSARAMPVLALQNHLNLNSYQGELSLCYHAKVGELDSARRVHLVVEHPERYQIRVNGREVHYDGLPFWRDIRWMPIDISGMLESGDNEIELFCLNFEPGNLASILDQDARYGTEIEAVMLVGDFSVAAQTIEDKPFQSVWQQWELPPLDLQCFAPDSFVLGEPTPLQFGDSTTQGLPFYAGALQLKTRLPVAVKGARRAVLRIEKLDAPVAQIAIDGRDVAALWAHPLEVELDETALKGEELTITLYGSLRNLLGPHHHIEGELVQVGPEHFSPHYDKTIEAKSAFVRWTNGETSPLDWSDRYCMVSLGEIGAITLEIARD